MRRLFWLGVGIAVGVLVARQVTKAARAYSPSSLAGTARNSAAGFVERMRDFVDDVREGMAEREAQIHEAFERGISLEDLDEYGPVGIDEQDGRGNGAGVRR